MASCGGEPPIKMSRCQAVNEYLRYLDWLGMYYFTVSVLRIRIRTLYRIYIHDLRLTPHTHTRTHTHVASFTPFAPYSSRQSGCDGAANDNSRTAIALSLTHLPIYIEVV